METFFLAVLVVIMIVALASGYPVAFALPGSAIIAIGLAAFFGYMFEGDSSAYFAVTMLLQFTSYFMSSSHKLIQNKVESK